MKKTPNRVILINVLCTALLNGISMIMMPIYSSMLGTDNYGLASIYTTWSSVFSIIIGLQTASSLAVSQKDFKKEEQLSYQSNSIYIGVIMTALMMVICLIFIKPLSNFLNIPSWSVLILCPHAFGIFCVGFLNSKFTYEFKQEKNLLVSVGMSVGAAAFSVALITIFPPEYAYMGKVIGGAIPQMLCGLLLVAFYIRKVGFQFNRVYVKYAMAYGTPLIFSNLCILLFESSDKLMLQRMQSNSAVGIYTLAFNFSAILSSIWYALNHAWGPFYFRYEAEKNDEAILTHARNIARLFSVLSTGFLLLAPEFFRIFSDSAFWSGDTLIPIFAIGYYANYIRCFAVNHQYCYKKTKAISAVSIGSAVLNIVLNAILIPKYGVYGAAVATAMANIASMLACWYTAKRCVSKDRRFPLTYKTFLPYAVLFCVGVMLFPLKSFWWIRWLLGALIGLLQLRHIWKEKQIF